MGIYEGTDIRDANWRRRHNEGRSESAEAGEEGAVLGAWYEVEVEVQVFPNGEVQYLHPKDGVYPEKVNPGRQGVGVNFRSIGKNVNPIEVKFTGKQVYDL